MRRAPALALYYVLAKNLPRQIGGGMLRSLLARRLFDSFGVGAKVHEGAHFGSGVGLSIGRRSYLGRGTFVSLGAPVQIGADVMVGPEVMIMTGVHGASTESPMIEQPSSGFPIKIGDDVLIGARSIILPGVEIGSGSIVGAGSVVTRDIPPLVVAAGVPARVLRHR